MSDFVAGPAPVEPPGRHFNWLVLVYVLMTLAVIGGAIFFVVGGAGADPTGGCGGG